jgi:ketosteroid isomerase-like protein
MLKLLVVSALLGVTAAQQAPEQALQALTQADSELSAAVAGRDLERIVAFYAEDAVLLPTAKPLVTGKAAIRAEWEHILAIPDLENAASRSGADVAASGDLGYTWGTYLAKMLGEDGKPVAEPGKWVTVWKRGDDGRWLVAVETYNTDVPPPDHK